MAHIELQAQNRTITGNQSRKLRRDGILPAVVFGKSFGSTNVQVVYSDFYKVYKQSGKNHVIDLIIDGKKTPVIVHDIDVHPVKGLPRHIDFLAVNLKEKVTASVPVEITGEAIGIKEQGGVLIQNLEEIEVSALPDSIPGSIVVDVTNLKEIGDHISVEQLDIEKSFEYVTEGTIVTLVAQSKEEDFEKENETIIEGEETESTEETEEASAE